MRFTYLLRVTVAVGYFACVHVTSHIFGLVADSIVL